MKKRNGHTTDLKAGWAGPYENGVWKWEIGNVFCVSPRCLRAFLFFVEMHVIIKVCSGLG